MIQNRPALLRCVLLALLSVSISGREVPAQEQVDADTAQTTLATAQRWIGQQSFEKAVLALEPLVAADPSAAVEKGGVDPVQMSEDQDLKGILNEPEFHRLFSASSYPNPLVENARVLGEWRGEAAIDQFGWVARNIGDVDGDGKADVVIAGAPQNDENGRDTGRVYVFSGKTGKVIHTWEGEARGDPFGSTVAGWCDENGILLAMGAPNAGPGKRGCVYVHKDLSGTPAFVIEAAPTGGQLGSMFISILGDADGDGSRRRLPATPSASTPRASATSTVTGPPISS